MNALHLYYSPETLAKLEKLAQLQPSFQKRLDMLQFCAFALAQVAEQAGQLPLDTPSDLVAFLQCLDKAGEAINLQAQAIPSYGAIEGTLDYPELYRFVYLISSNYFEKRAWIRRCGKEALLYRLATKLAGNRQI